MELHKGVTLQGGKYTLEKKLGSGSFGITYLANMRVQVAGQLGSIETTAPVAIKEFFMSELNSRSADSSVVEGTQNTVVTNYRRKFRTEAQNLGRMGNPGIVNVLEVWDENNTTYYSMEYVEGLSLDDYIRQYGPIPERKAIEMFLQLADAVQHMHSNRMLHLDIKPKNAMLRKDGRLLLIDFGLSKQYDANGEPESSTRVGGGTPGYAPIEQADYHNGKDFPVTMDIYALGATLFKMLTGQTPPTASSIVSDGFPTQILERCNVGRHAIEVVTKAMSPSKRNRYQSVVDMRADLCGHGFARTSPNNKTKRDNGQTRKTDDRTRVIDEETPIADGRTRIINENTGPANARTQFVNSEQDERELRSIVRHQMDRKEYRDACRTCNRFLNEGRCPDVAQELLERVESLMNKKKKESEIAKALLFFIISVAIIITMVLIIPRFV